MGITIFVILFSIGMIALLTVLLHIKKIQQIIFASLIALLVVFDFALLSLDKIYGLHQEQDELYLEKQRIYDTRISQQLSLYQTLTGIQLDATLQVLTQNSKQETEAGILKKLAWRDELIAQMELLEFDNERKFQVKKKINQGVHAYLMETLNREMIQSLGHRIYSEFVRSKPRDKWTDELFVNELVKFLNKQKIMKDNIQFAIDRVKEFKSTGTLIAAQSA